MKHFGIEFEETLIPLDQDDTAIRIAEVSPSGTVPALWDDEIRIWDSLAICEYLAEKYPEKHLWPNATEARATARSISCEMHSGFTMLRQHLPMKCHEVFPNFEIPEVSRNNIARVIQIWNTALARSGGPYLFGEFSIADAMYAPVVFRFNTYGVQLSGASATYLQTMLQHPGMKEWLAAAQREQLKLKRYE